MDKTLQIVSEEAPEVTALCEPVSYEQDATEDLTPEDTSVLQHLRLDSDLALRRRFMVTDEPIKANLRVGLLLEVLDKLAETTALLYVRKIGAVDDNRFRAFDAKTGKELWAVKLDAAAGSVPSTYEGKDGRQYVVVTSPGNAFAQEPATSDAIYGVCVAEEIERIR